jgi:hypothetical protein
VHVCRILGGEVISGLSRILAARPALVVVMPRDPQRMADHGCPKILRRSRIHQGWERGAGNQFVGDPLEMTNGKPAGAPGLEVSPRDLKRSLLQLGVRQEPFEGAVLAFQILEPRRIVGLQTAELVTPAERLSRAAECFESSYITGTDLVVDGGTTAL